MIIDDFMIRSYSKAELACLYNPTISAQAARRQLRRWIQLCVPLCRELEALHTAKRAHNYSPLQVQTIVKYLGTP